MSMEFKNRTHGTKYTDPHRWNSTDCLYTIVRYHYWRADGKTCSAEDACEPYFAAYTRYDGKRIGPRNAKIPSFEEAVKLCTGHLKENSK